MKIYSLILLFLLATGIAMGQDSIPIIEPDSTLIPEVDPLTEYLQQVPSKPIYANKDARFYRPNLLRFQHEKGTFSLGGYAAANTEYGGTDGETEGMHFQFQELQLYAQSHLLNNRLHFIVDAGIHPISHQFAVKEAALNIRFHDAFNLRGGVILPPLGYFNQNGDSPANNFVEGAISSTTILPGIFSDVGFGINGNLPLGVSGELTYEVYAVNGLQAGVVENDMPRTAIHLGVPDNVFGEDNNSELAYTARIGLRNPNMGEIGFSYYEGVYNTTEVGETEVDDARKLSIMAIDARAQIERLIIKGEVGLVSVDVYNGLGQLFGEKQLGYHVEASYPLLEYPLFLEQQDNQLNLVFRYEAVDYNQGLFEQTDTNIFDERQGVRAGLVFQIAQIAMLKANYAYFWNKDILGNPSQTAAIQLGFASYF